MKDRPGVERRNDPHHRHAGLLMPLTDGRLDRSRPAQLREQRGVDVERSKPRHVDRRRWENVSIRDDDRDVRLECAKRVEKLRATRLHRLEHWDAFVFCDELHRWRLQLRSRTTNGLVRLSDDAGNLEALAEERP